MRVRVRATSGVKTLDVHAECSFAELKAAIASAVNIAAEAQTLLTGFPPKKLHVDDRQSIASYIRQGDTIVVQQNAVERASARTPLEHAPAPAPAPAMVASTSARDSSIVSQGEMVVRVVPDDNSCLFRSVNGVLARPHSDVVSLRRIVATAIGANPGLYNMAFLGRTNAEYKNWIMSENAWGGAIELGILSSHFRIEIGAFDIRTMRMDRYGEGNGFKQIGYLVYDGIHYNYLALALGGNVRNSDLDVTQFDVHDVYALDAARSVANVAHNAKQFTDTQNFTLKCADCGTRLKGETDAVKHATATGHGNFSEV